MIKILLIMCILMTYKVFAYDLVIRVNGFISGIPCTVETNMLKLDLGKIYASELVKPGASSQWVNGTIKLSNCPSGVQTLSANFSGEQGNYYYKNKGTAKNVEIQLQTATGIDLNNGKRQNLSITPQREALLPVRIRAYSGGGKAGDGTIQTTISITYIYN